LGFGLGLSPQSVLNYDSLGWWGEGGFRKVPESWKKNHSRGVTRYACEWTGNNGKANGKGAPALSFSPRMTQKADDDIITTHTHRVAQKVYIWPEVITIQLQSQLRTEPIP